MALTKMKEIGIIKNAINFEHERIKDEIKADTSLLESKLTQYGSYKKAPGKKSAGQSCVFCSSSDALHIKGDRYKCFSCGASGDIFNLVEAKEGLEFYDALKLLANEKGIELPNHEYTEEEKEEFKRIAKERKRLENYLNVIHRKIKMDTNLELKYRMSCMIDRFKEYEGLTAEYEVINFAHYKPNKKVNITSRIGENAKLCKDLINMAKEGKKGLLIAPTGSGKTYSIIKYLKDSNTKAIFVLPNSANVDQVMKEYRIHGAHGTNLSATSALKNSKNVIVMTWDKAKQLADTDLRDYIIVVDEVHQVLTDAYRDSAIKALEAILSHCKGQLDITATPNKLNFKEYDYIGEYKQEKKTNYKINLYNKIDIARAVKIINKSKNFGLLLDDKVELSRIATMTDKKVDVVTSDTKDHSKLYDLIMTRGNMGDYEGLLNTTTLVAGVNINNPNITDIVVIGIKDISTIVQYVARYRGLEEVNVHIFNTYRDNCFMHDIEWAIEKAVKRADDLAKFYNDAREENHELSMSQFSVIGAEVNAINIDSNVYFDKETGTYRADDKTIRTKLYRDYYQSRTMENFAVLLEEYYFNIDLHYIDDPNEKDKKDRKEYRKNIKEIKEQILEELKVVKSILVGYDAVRKGQSTYNIMDYHRANGMSLEKVQKEYLKLGIHDKVIEGGFKNFLNNYSDYVLNSGFSCDVAWELASRKSNNKVFGQFDVIIYEEIKKKYPNMLKSKNTVENRIYEWLISELKPGMSYTKEHIDILVDTFKVRFGENWSFDANKLQRLLNKIFVIEKTTVREKSVFVDPKNYTFYKNISSLGSTKNKLINIHTIKSIVSIESVKKELAVNSSDFTINHYVQRRINQAFNGIDSFDLNILTNKMFII